MELRVLRYFVAIVQEESISLAAEHLHITQPTLSRQLMDLEDELGIRLINRGKRNRKVTLTEKGRLFYERACELIQLADKIQTEFSGEEEPVSGGVYIGGGETDAMRLISKAAVELHEEHPHIRFHIFSGNGPEVAERLDSGLLDFGIMVGVVDLSKYSYLPLPVTDTWGVIMRKDSPLAGKDGIEPKDLADKPLIFSRQALSNNELTGWYGGSFDEANIVATYNLIYNATLLVAEGLGYALTLEKLVATTGDSEFRFVPLKPKVEARLSIVWKKNRHFSRAARLFLDRLRGLISEDTAQTYDGDA